MIVDVAVGDVQVGVGVVTASDATQQLHACRAVLRVRLETLRHVYIYTYIVILLVEDQQDIICIIED